MVFFSSTLFSDYLYKDEVTSNPNFKKEIEILGSELYQKTGISVKLILLKKLPKNVHIAQYEKEIVKGFKQPTVVLTFSQLDQRVDILASPHSLYKYFDKKQILSPVASWLQSFFMAVFFANSWDEFKTTASDYGGTIIPLLAQKSKPKDEISKYSTAMFNGYADLVEQIASAKNVKLEHSVGNANKSTLMFLKIVFYGVIIYAILLTIRRKLRKDKRDD